MLTQTTMLDDERARIDVEVPAERVEHDLRHTLGHLSESVKIPGFRPGKVPPSVVLQRLGRREVFEETLREHLDRWYAEALAETTLKAADRPDIDWGEIPESGAPFRFTATVPLRPKGVLPADLKLEAPRPEVEVPAGEVDAEIERLRGEVSPLRTVERPAAAGDLVELRIDAGVGATSVAGMHADGMLARLGEGRLLPQIERGLTGKSAGDVFDVSVALPDDYPDRKLAGKTAEVHVALLEVLERELVPADDAFARSASEFDSLAELRADIERTWLEALEREADSQFRVGVVDALAEAVEVDVPRQLVFERAETLIHEFSHNLEQRGLNLREFLTRSGRTPEQIQVEFVSEAIRQLRGEIAIEAFAEREGIVVDDERLAQLMREEAAGEEDVEALVQEVMASSAKERVREELRFRLAAERAVELATPISFEAAEAKAKLWTPEKEAATAAKPEIWTPGS